MGTKLLAELKSGAANIRNPPSSELSSKIMKKRRAHPPHNKRRAGENPINMSGSDLCIPRNETARGLLFPKQNYNDLPPSFCTHVSASDLYIPRIGLPILLPTDPGNI